MYDAAPLTVFVFVRSDCSACQNAKPMLGAISADLQKRSIPFKLVAGGLHAAEEAHYAREIGVAAGSQVTIPLADIQELQVVPTLVLINQRGDVLYSAEGIPTDSDRQDLLNAVATAPAVQ